MKFGEKVALLRKENGMSQKDFCEAIGVPIRTVRGWEIDGRYPRSRDMYDKIAEVLGTNKNFLLTEDEELPAAVAEAYGQQAAAQAKEIMDQAKALYAGGTLSDEDKLAFLQDIQQLFLESKKVAHDKFTPKKYRK